MCITSSKDTKAFKTALSEPVKPDVWVVWPTVNKEQSQKMLKDWQAFGYKVAVLVNPPFTNEDFIEAERVIVQDKWMGFPTAANILCKNVPGNIVVVAGDDLYPDPNFTAQEIGMDFLKRFPDTFGLMQPTGDKYGLWDKCAVSPWIGREFINKAYEGKGPYREEYFHYWSDHELQKYAMMNKCFQQRKDLIQYHDHWQRKKNPKRPDYLLQAKKMWHKDKKIFERRYAQGYPSE